MKKNCPQTPRLRGEKQKNTTLHKTVCLAFSCVAAVGEAGCCCSPQGAASAPTAGLMTQSPAALPSGSCLDGLPLRQVTTKKKTAIIWMVVTNEALLTHNPSRHPTTAPPMPSKFLHPQTAAIFGSLRGWRVLNWGCLSNIQQSTKTLFQSLRTKSVTSTLNHILISTPNDILIVFALQICSNILT